MSESRNLMYKRIPVLRDDPHQEYTWRCSSPACRAEDEAKERRLELERDGEEQRKARAAELALLDTDPGKVLSRFGVPSLYLYTSLDSFAGGEKYVSACRRFCGDPPQGLFLFGSNVGCGKTHLAIGIMRELFVQGCRSMHFVVVPELLLEIRSSFRGENPTEMDVLQKYIRPKVLVLDDLGAEKTSEHSVATLYTLINRRMLDNRATVITSNLSLSQLEATLDARIASRLSAYVNVCINMPDHRKLVRRAG